VVEEKLIDELKKLVERWRDLVEREIPDAYRDRGLERKYLNLDNWAGGVSDCADELEELIEEYNGKEERSDRD